MVYTELDIKDGFFYIDKKPVNKNTNFYGILTNIYLSLDYQNIESEINLNTKPCNFTIRLQCDERKIFFSNGQLERESLDILEKMLMYINKNGCTVLLELFNKKHESSVSESYIMLALTNIINWLKSTCHENIMIKIADHSNGEYKYESLRPQNIYKYAAAAKKISGGKFFIGCCMDFSYAELCRVLEKNLEHSDFVVCKINKGIEFNIEPLLKKYKKPVVADFIFSEKEDGPLEAVELKKISYVKFNSMTIKNVNNRTYKNIFITKQTGNGLVIENCNNLIFDDCKISNCAGEAFFISDSSDIEIKNCRIENVRTAIYALNSKNIFIHDNFCKNLQGPKPRGQFVLFKQVHGNRNIIKNNRIINEEGKSKPEDIINLCDSHGTTHNYIDIHKNYIEGGGPSRTGNGIVLGDKGGSYQHVHKNILINPGQCGIACVGGNDIKIDENSICGKPKPHTNVGIYAWNQQNKNSNNVRIKNNNVSFFNKSGKSNSWLDGGGITNLIVEDNNWDLPSDFIEKYIIPNI